VILPIYISWVAKIIDVRHCAQPHFHFLKLYFSTLKEKANFFSYSLYHPTQYTSDTRCEKGFSSYTKHFSSRR
jgi:hypothetical protein